jgi:hypothetical protein
MGDALLMECGDCFNDYIIMVCIQAKDTDLLFLFVKKILAGLSALQKVNSRDAQ